MNVVYVDTSVFGGYFDKEFSAYSIRLLHEFKRGAKRMMISPAVMEELATASSAVRLLPFRIPFMYTTFAKSSKKAWELAAAYIAEGVLTNNSHTDAMHIATATLQNADVLASWNFKHMVNIGKIKQYNAINKRMGYRQINILSPREIFKTTGYE